MASTFQADKDAIVAVVKSNNCGEAVTIDQTAADYNDLVNILFDNSKVFDCDTAHYLEDILDVIDDATLVANGIYYNKNSGGNIHNPVAVVKCTYDNIFMDAGGTVKKLLVTRHAAITNIILSNATILQELRIEGVSTVALADSSAASCCIGAILVRKCSSNANASTLSAVKYGSCFQVFVDDGATYGGVTCAPTGTPI